MPRRLIAISIFLTLWVTGAAYAAAPPIYYLALGDSLARGVQPDRAGNLVDTNQGYVDDLYAYARLRRPDLNLQLVKLGCSGETTTTMIAGGGRCSYPLGSQLAQAADFIRTNHVALVTLTIGGDNILLCVNADAIDPTQVIDAACVQQGLVTVFPDLVTILGALRGAAALSSHSHDLAIVGSNYNDPLLGLWRFGLAGQMLANQSLPTTQALNTFLQGAYAVFHVPVADVAQAFRITDIKTIPLLDVPVNVFLALSWTWMNANPPRGPDVHPNAIGYGVMAGAFVKAIAAQ